jgi:hypothetical protein
MRKIKSKKVPVVAVAVVVRAKARKAELGLFLCTYVTITFVTGKTTEIPK